MDKLSQNQIMAIEKDILFKDGYFEGHQDIKEYNYEELILNNYQYFLRSEIEHDKKYKQPIGYLIIVNHEQKTIFSYQRASKDNEYKEKRLQGRWSWGIGGHIEKNDLEFSANNNPIKISTARELEEETGLKIDPDNLKNLGYINNDTDDIGSVHFGVLYIIETELLQLSSSSLEIKNGQFRSIQKLLEMIKSNDYQVEEWSRISLDLIKQYLKIN